MQNCSAAHACRSVFNTPPVTRACAFCCSHFQACSRTHLINAVRDAWQHTPTHKRVWALAAPMILCNLSVPLVALISLAIPLSSAALALMQPSAQLDELARSYLYIRLFGLPAALATYALVGWLLV